MKFQDYRRGFTFIELLFVIVIMGIVGGLALEAIRQYYEGIYRNQEYSKRVAEADHILDQLSKYFENAIDKSIVNLDQNKADGALNGACIGRPVVDNGDFTVAFVGVDQDTLRTTTGKPGWSERVGPNPFVGNALISTDADLPEANAIIGGLYPTSGLGQSAIYNLKGAEYGCVPFNWNADNNLSAYFTIVNPYGGGNALTLVNHAPVSPDNDHKYLLRTGYAFRVLDNGKFMIYSNFRPWLGEKYTAALKQNILGENVEHFYTDSTTDTGERGEYGLIWRLKVCMRGIDSNLSTSDVESQAICRERRVHVRY